MNNLACTAILRAILGVSGVVFIVLLRLVKILYSCRQAKPLSSTASR